MRKCFVDFLRISVSQNHNPWSTTVENHISSSSFFKFLAANIVFDFEFYYQEFKMTIKTLRKLLLN